MAFVATRVLIVHKQLQFAVGIKQALEHTGRYEVMAFTTATAALEHLRDRPYDVVLLDFTLNEMPGPDMVLRFRSIQPDLAFIVSPNTPDVSAYVQVLKLNAIIDLPLSARQLIPVIQHAVSQTYDFLPDTAESPPTLDETETLQIDSLDTQPPEFTTLDSIIIKTGGLEQTIGTETLDVDTKDESSSRIGDSQPIEVILRGKLSQLQKQDSQQGGSLSAEEAPAPLLEDNGTLQDFIAGMEHADPEQVTTHMMTGRTAQPHHDDEEQADDTQHRSTAQMVLESALDNSQALRISLAELLNSVEPQFPDVPGVKPLPSWVDEIQRFVQEPDFLKKSLPHLPDEYDIAWQTTDVVNGDQLEVDPGNLETDIVQAEITPPKSPPSQQGGAKVESEVESQVASTEEENLVEKQQESRAELPPYEFGHEPAPAHEGHHPTVELPPYEFDSVAGHDEVIEEQKTDSEPIAVLPPYEFNTKSISTETEPKTNLLADIRKHDHETEAVSSQPFTYLAEDDPRLTQLALALTQASLELTTDATLLSRNGQIVSYVGALPYEDIEDLKDEIAGDWDASPGESRIRYMTLPGSGQDYVLYSRRTDYDFTLSMIFAGNLPLRVIRRQGKRLVEALEALPQAPEAPAVADIDELAALEEEASREVEAAISSTQQTKALQTIEAEAGRLDAPSRSSYTYIWLIKDPDHPFNAAIAQAVVNDLDAWLQSKGWQPETLHVFEDYVLLTMDAPVEDMAKNVIDELKAMTAEIVNRVDDNFDLATLWADSYFALMPGRKLHQDEIQHFINFARVH